MSATEPTIAISQSGIVSSQCGAAVPAEDIAECMEFMLHLVEVMKQQRVGDDDADVEKIRQPVEHHYADDRGKPSMYQRFESALYDDAEALVTLWRAFDQYDRDRLRKFRHVISLDRDGLMNDRHPRKVFDRSPIGIAALIFGTITVWMSILKTYSGENLDDLFILIRFNWIVGTMWIAGLFVVVWYIIKTHRNNAQVAFLSTVSRALDLYLNNPSNHSA